MATQIAVPDLGVEQAEVIELLVPAGATVKKAHRAAGVGQGQSGAASNRRWRTGVVVGEGGQCGEGG